MQYCDPWLTARSCAVLCHGWLLTCAAACKICSSPSRVFNARGTHRGIFHYAYRKALYRRSCQILLGQLASSLWISRFSSSSGTSNFSALFATEVVPTSTWSDGKVCEAMSNMLNLCQKKGCSVPVGPLVTYKVISSGSNLQNVTASLQTPVIVSISAVWTQAIAGAGPDLVERVWK
ncbi:hypothetical protein CONLIGDRAFT_300403 [Coniochaeta ligniaria NRRL 30616]|uniref:Uncharacterized protein n=1 Tax=Coniochaeta ligniaria NRRL 30616 TaxID=1408157 RepID=A0A1J7IVA2_9PEZI|nr:hypothetical protein CONLIGDRAFT_300403 [Coniochaeta ligniaria NRRL 30616]